MIGDNMWNWLKNAIKEVYQGLTHKKGKFDSMVFWYSVLCINMTWGFHYLLLKDSTLIIEYTLAYCATLLGHNVASRFVDRKAPTQTAKEQE